MPRKKRPNQESREDSGPRKNRSSRKDIRESRNSRENREELLYGKHAVHALQDLPERLRHLYVQEEKREREKELLAAAAEYGIPCSFLSSREMYDLLGDVKHQGVAASMLPVPTVSFDEWAAARESSDEPALVVVLDHIQDPQNMGAIIRTAEVAGALGVLFPERRGALPTEAVVRASAGAALRVPLLRVVNLPRALQDLQNLGFWTVGMEPSSSNLLWEGATLPPRLALVLGSEGKGLSRLVGERCDELAALPMLGSTGSLNVSAAAAVGIFEWVRGFRQKTS